MPEPVSPADTRTENNVQRGLREAALAKLRRSTELACGYPDATITRAEAWQLLDERDALLAVGERDKAEREMLMERAATLTLAMATRNAERERDRRQIAQLTERVDTLKKGPLLGILETYRREHPDDHLVLSVVIAEIQEIAAVLAGEEDAGNG